VVVTQRSKKADDGEILSEGGSESGDETRQRRRRHSESDADSPAAAAGDKDRKRKKPRFLIQCLKLVFSLPCICWILSDGPPANLHLYLILCKQVRKVVWTRKGVCATVVTAGHCIHAELASGHALASCCSCCVHSSSLW